MKLSLLVWLLIWPIGATAQEKKPSVNLPAPLPAWRINRPEVAAVQTELLKRGIYQGRLTGNFDRRTREAVKAYQAQANLPITSRIDRPTYESLGLPYPAAVRAQPGTMDKIGTGMKDTTVGTSKALGAAAGKVKEGTQYGLEKTWDAGAAAADLTKDAAQGVGGATAKGVKGGAKGITRGAQKTANTLIGRPDEEILREINVVLAANPQTSKWISTVKEGRVTLKTQRGNRADTGPAVTEIRKIAGVKSVFVIAQ